MSSLVAAVNQFETAGVIGTESVNVINFKSSNEVYGENSKASALAVALGDFKYRSETRDHKLVDYFLIGVISVFIHSTVVDHFNGMDFDQEIIAPIKQPPKVQITLTRPQPKPVAPPPPPPQVKAEPPKPKVVPLKPPKPRPVQKKIVEQVPVIEPTPVINSAPTNTAPVAAPAAPPAPTVVEEKVTAPIAGADYLNNPAPSYPEAAQERGLEGKVLMKVHVQPDGKPDKITVSKSSGHQILDDAAVKTVYKWSFVPAKRGSTPIAGYVTVPITFNLS